MICIKLDLSSGQKFTRKTRKDKLSSTLQRPMLTQG